MPSIEQLWSTILKDENVEFHLSVDCVIFSIQGRELKVLLTRISPDTPWLLPGGFIHKDENSDQAAARILKSRTGVDRIYLNQFQIFSKPERFPLKKLISKLPLSVEELGLVKDLPDRTISIGYFALVDYESLTITGGIFDEESHWCDIEALPELAHDHKEIITGAVKALRKEVHFKPIAHKLLPEEFTLPELQNLYEVILGKSLDRGSFNRKILGWGIFERLGLKESGLAHRRPYMYRFDKEKYKSAIKKGTIFGM